ncbi:LANO_0H13256g1_1 [Lachancea nothofagi CBS 11611]|uniref:LANO_0H13256g1_1 n=1 Tax=Lachancea nothofagi CBS 11611 TaxID=1266666 RepID=A0A1G4KME4_9SACH|nr:LANO_0H13256g1_1 [Lachancea nothofagi CBS 11611]
MQGGVRRKNDLLPRYRGQGGTGAKKSFLTTPMKKVLIYLVMLAMVYFSARTLLETRNSNPGYELENVNSNTVSGVTDDGAMESPQDIADSQAMSPQGVVPPQGKKPANAKVPKEKFNNEVAMQQEVKNLEREQDYQKKKSTPIEGKQEVGNDVKAVKQQAETKDQLPVDEQAKMINDKAPYKKTDSAK